MRLAAISEGVTRMRVGWELVVRDRGIKEGRIDFYVFMASTAFFPKAKACAMASG
jgi:hypothetical protein